MSDLLNNAIFDSLFNPPDTPGGEYVEENFLEPLYNGDQSSTPILADWLEDHGHSGLADTIRFLLSVKNVMDQFRLLMREEMFCPAQWLLPSKASRADRARKAAQAQVLQLFPKFMMSKATDEVNEFTRMKMKEAGYCRRLMPPTPLSTLEGLSLTLEDGPVKVLDT